MKQTVVTLFLALGAILVVVSLYFIFVPVYEPYHVSEDGEGYEIVYATPVDSADECTQYEQFDAERSECFFMCETEVECESIMKKVDAELDQLADDYEQFSQDFKEFEGDSDILEENAEASYTILPGEEFVLVKGEETEMGKRVVSWLKIISPDDFSDQHLSRLVLYAQNDDTGAYVEPDPSGEKWNMYVNMNTFADGEKEMVFTLLHEFAHILTLNFEQMNREADEETCETYFVQEGCLHRDSYLFSFFERFWKQYDLGSSQFDLEGSNVYDEHPKDFVNDYAATNPGEDIAESFASFVLRTNSEGGTVGEKQEFFGEYTELVFLRDNIRSRLTTFVRARMSL